MITGVICICKICKKQFVINIRNIEPDDIKIIENQDCYKCNEKNKKRIDINQ